MPLPLIRTKLHRPPVARDHLHRQHLLDWLDVRRHRPLTLVSATAGYGKSTLASWFGLGNKRPLPGMRRCYGRLDLN